MTIKPVPWALLGASLLACSKDADAPPAAAMAASPSAASAMAAVSQAPASPGAALPVRRGKSTFLIDAPLEKIKGEAADSRGQITLDPSDLGKTRGEIGFKLSTLKTTTFGNEGKDSSQTEHARNWMQVGPDARPADRTRYEWATFRVTSVDVTPTRLADAPEKDGARTLKGRVSGVFSLHGVDANKTFPFVATVRGPVDQPISVTLRSDVPFEVSMQAHDVKPRDGVGAFLQGGLEKIGKKIDDRIQVSFDIEAGG